MTIIGQLGANALVAETIRGAEIRGDGTYVDTLLRAGIVPIDISTAPAAHSVGARPTIEAVTIAHTYRRLGTAVGGFSL